MNKSLKFFNDLCHATATTLPISDLSGIGILNTKEPLVASVGIDQFVKNLLQLFSP